LVAYSVHFVVNIDKSKAEAFAIFHNPHTVADLVLAHMKRTGKLPPTVQECIVRSAEQPPEAIAKYGQVSIDTPYGGDVVVKSVVDRMVISFPPSPDGLALRDGVLVSTADGREVRLLDMIGRRDDAALRRANAYLWEKWRLLASGQPTGLAWLDAGKPAEPSPPKTTTAPTTAPATSSAPATLPAAWLGDWSGPAELLAPGRPPRPFHMELHVAPLAESDRYTWTIIYGEGEQRQERPYVLIVQDAARGLYAVDEGNSIVLPQVLLGDAFYGAFEIEGATLHTVERLEGRGTPDERITVEITAFSGEPTPTGGQNDTPAVQARVPSTVQRAVLRRAVAR